jgi:hypothetical protein
MESKKLAFELNLFQMALLFKYGRLMSEYACFESFSIDRLYRFIRINHTIIAVQNLEYPNVG